MKLRKWMPLLALAVCFLAFLGYRVYDRTKTDSKAPQITIDESQELLLSVADPQDALLQGVTAYDDRDGDVTALAVVESIGQIRADGSATVTYAAFDRSGNVSKAQRQVCYGDYESPCFGLSRALVFAYGSNFDVLNIIQAEDCLDGDISYRVKATSLDQVSISQEGTHDVQFRVTNSLGETVTLVLPVEVYSAGRYNAELTLKEYLIYIKQGEEFEPEDYLSQFRTNEDTTSLSTRVPSDIRVRTVGRVNTSQPGIYTVAYTANQTTDRDTYTGYTKLIVIVEE